MADASSMQISTIAGPVADNDGDEYGARVQKLAQNVAKAEGEGAVALIEGAASAAPPPVGLHGQGTHVNTYA